MHLSKNVRMYCTNYINAAGIKIDPCTYSIQLNEEQVLLMRPAAESLHMPFQPPVTIDVFDKLSKEDPQTGWIVEYSSGLGEAKLY